MKARDYVNEKGERIVQFGRVKAVFASLTATDCKVYVDIDPDALLHASEVVFLAAMVSIAQNDTHHERSSLWIAGDIHEATMNDGTVKAICIRAENVELKWQLNRVRRQLQRQQP